MEPEVMLSKLESLTRCLRRIKEKTPDSPEVLKNDLDSQDLIIPY